MRNTLPAAMHALGRTRLFEDCSQRQLRRAERFCTVVNVIPTQPLCRPANRPGQLVIIIAGRAVAFEPHIPPQWLGPGDYCGALAAHDRYGDEPTTVTALTAGTVVVIERRELAGLFGACPSVATRLIEGTDARRIDSRLERVATALTASSAIRSLS